MMLVYKQWFIGQEEFYNGEKKKKNIKEHDQSIFVGGQALGLYLLTIVSVSTILVPRS